MGVANYIFWSEIGSGFGEPGGTSPRKNSQEKYTCNMSTCTAVTYLFSRWEGAPVNS